MSPVPEGWSRVGLLAVRQAGSSLAVAVALALAAGAASAQRAPRDGVQGVNLQKLLDGLVGVISYTVTPDVTTSSLAIQNAATANPSLTMTQFGGGFTWSKGTPLYLEGNAAYSRYDPLFIASDGTQTRPLGVKWDAFSATGGIGWDFPISEHWVARPIFNFTLGRVVSDIRLAKWWLEQNTNADFDYLDGGRMNSYGLGGSLMLDYESFAPEHDDDIELRYTNVELRAYGTHNPSVEGTGKAESLSLWTRRRIPIDGWQAFGRPVRYVLEGAYTRFLGDQGELGLTEMASLGLGIEYDSSAHDIWVTRWRAVARYKFGSNLSGWALGLAVSF
jgi:hypothetical protein